MPFLNTLITYITICNHLLDLSQLLTCLQSKAQTLTQCSRPFQVCSCSHWLHLASCTALCIRLLGIQLLSSLQCHTISHLRVGSPLTRLLFLLTSQFLFIPKDPAQIKPSLIPSSLPSTLVSQTGCSYFRIVLVCLPLLLPCEFLNILY